jgi:surface polysaccharide O-acyltransferase-like enzyme
MSFWFNPDDRVVLRKVPLATAVAAVGSTITNVGVYYAALRYGRMSIGYTETVVASVIGAVLAGLVYWLLARYTEHAVRWFTVVATIVIGVYGVGPVAAAYAPYMEGAELFTLTTVVATEIMHIVSGAWVLWALLRLAREAR